MLPFIYSLMVIVLMLFINFFLRAIDRFLGKGLNILTILEYLFLNLFEGIVVSGDEKIKKPDPRLYQILIDRYGIQPGKSIFIDDTKINVDIAVDLGFQTIHFLSANQLQEEFQKWGLM